MRLADCLKNQTGLYTFREASLFAKIPISTLRYWFVGNIQRPPVRKAVVDDAGLSYITFQDFIEAVAIRELRTQFKLTLPKIREAVIEATKSHGVRYPFSNRNYSIHVSGRDLQIDSAKYSGPVQLTGRLKKQISIRSVSQLLMEALRFNNDGIGYEYVAANYGTNLITLNPHIMFGSPRVSKVPYSAVTLWRASKAEGNKEDVARLYDVDVTSVNASCRYCEEELRLAA